MPKDAHGPGIQAVTPKLASELGLASHATHAHPGASQNSAARRRRPDGASQNGASRMAAADTGTPGGSVRDNGVFAAPAAPRVAGPGLALRAVRRLAARRGRTGRARPPPAGAAVAAGLRPPHRGPGPGRGAGRDGAAARRGRPRGADARHRPAVPVAAARGQRQDPADRVRRPPGPPEPGPVDRPARPEPAAAVAGRRRRPGLAAAVRRHGWPRRPGNGQRGQQHRHPRAVPGPGIARHERIRPDPGRPRGRARPDRGARAARRWCRRHCPRSPWSWSPTGGPTRCGSRSSVSATDWQKFPPNGCGWRTPWTTSCPTWSGAPGR